MQQSRACTRGMRHQRASGLESLHTCLLPCPCRPGATATALLAPCWQIKEMEEVVRTGQKYSTTLQSYNTSLQVRQGLGRLCGAVGRGSGAGVGGGGRGNWACS